MGVAGPSALQASSSEDEEESEEVCVLDILEFLEGFLDVEVLPASPWRLDEGGRVCSKDAVSELVTDFCRTGDIFPEMLPFLESSSSDEDKSEEDGVCVFFTVVEFVVDFGVTEDVCSLGVFVLVHVFRDFFTGTFSSSSEEDESEEEVFLTEDCLDATICAGLDGEGFLVTSSLLSEDSELLLCILDEITFPLVRTEDVEAFLLLLSGLDFEDEGSLAGTAALKASPDSTSCSSLFFFFALCFFCFFVAPVGWVTPFTSLGSCLFFFIAA